MERKLLDNIRIYKNKMNKLIKLFIICAALAGACFAEQKVVFITAESRSQERVLKAVPNQSELTPYLKQGWKIIHISGTNGVPYDGGFRIWAVVIEKDESIVEKKDK
jgi:hypothetical protein